MLALIAFSLEAKLYGDVMLDCLFVVFGFYAWITWGGKLKEITTTRGKWVYGVVLGILATGALWYYLSGTDDPLPLKDAITTVFGVLATVYMVLRKIETWVVWFVVDLMYVWQYSDLPEPAWILVGLNVVWTAMAVGSFVIWKKKLKRNDGINY